MDTVHVPAPDTSVYKANCVVCFRTSEWKGGLFCCARTFQSFCTYHLDDYYGKTGNDMFVHVNTTRRVVPGANKNNGVQANADAEAETAPKRMAIGVEGGFDASVGDRIEFDVDYSFVHLPERSFESLNVDNDTGKLPKNLWDTCMFIIRAEDALHRKQISADAAAWGGEERLETNHKNLTQIDNPPAIPARGWRCQIADCGITDNLWLNLSDGTIFCGRKQFVTTDVMLPGNNHALEHFQSCGFPLVVKLGTITASGADVFSYDEDAMVIDPKLREHLKHFKIDMLSMEKTAKTMEEMEIDFNQKFIYSAITESGLALEPVFGSGHTGIFNLGNSCYINSIVQVLTSIPSLVSYYTSMPQPSDAQQYIATHNSLNYQAARMIRALMSGDYSMDPKHSEQQEWQNGIHPLEFRELIGRGHPEFATKHQQDAEEFLRYLLEKMDSCKTGADNVVPSDLFKFEIVECLRGAPESTRNTKLSDRVLALAIDTELVQNQADVDAYEVMRAKHKEQTGMEPDPETIVRPRISLASMLNAHFAAHSVGMFGLGKIIIGDFGRGSNIDSLKKERDNSFLSVLWACFTLEWLTQVSPNASDANRPITKQVRLLNFPPYLWVQVKRFMFADGSSVKFDGEITDVMEMDLSMFKANDQERQITSQPADETAVNEESVQFLEVCGFPRDMCVKALRKFQGNAERAADWLFNGAVEDAAPAGGQNRDVFLGEMSAVPASADNGKYKLMGFVSHVGNNTASGHYVCHVNKQGKWLIFNDEKVGLSAKTPFPFGYLYLFVRSDLC